MRILPLWKRNSLLIFLLGLYGAYILYLFGIFHIEIQREDDAGHLLVRLIAPAIEMGFCYALGQYFNALAFKKKSVIFKIAALALPLVVSVLYASQIYSLHISGNLISVLAIENREESRLIDTTLLYPILMVAIVWWLVYFYLYRSYQHDVEFRSPEDNHFRYIKKYAITVGLMLSPLLYLMSRQGSEGQTQIGYRQAPISSLAYNYFDYYKQKYQYAMRKTAKVITSKNRFPFESEDIYARPLPFKGRGVEHDPENVIVIFTEGTSAALLGCYGSAYPDITPNIDALSRQSMLVKNYYNHTAATYRGLQGQMVSGYPSAGDSTTASAWEYGDNAKVLSNLHYKSLPMVLRDMKYKSYFISPHHDTVALNALLRSLAFDEVYSYDSVSRELGPVSGQMTAGSLSDADLFGALRNLLESDKIKKAKSPFFVGTYNIGTHAFLDVSGDGKKYGDGTNPVLNKIHNYDYQLGEFLRYFFASKYAKDTILVFTVDHATYPDQNFRKVVSRYYRPYFVGEVPLLIYDPGHRLPNVFDAKGRTSIDFAPTLLHLLGIRRDENSFLGTSLFESNGMRFGVAAIGDEFFATDSQAVYYENQVPSEYQKEFDEQVDLIKHFYSLESENRIFNPTQ